MIFFSFHPSKVSWYQKTSCRAFCTVVVLIIWFFTKKGQLSRIHWGTAICLLLDGFISFCKPFLCQMPSFIRTLNPEKRGAYITFFKVNHKMRKKLGFFKCCFFYYRSCSCISGTTRPSGSKSWWKIDVRVCDFQFKSSRHNSMGCG